MMAINGTTITTSASVIINYTAALSTTYQELFVNLHETGLGTVFDERHRVNGTIGCSRACLSWKKLVLVALFCLLIVITVVGNTLVILSVLTTRRLRTVTNCFVMSLAVADWLVGIFVMPPAVIVFVVESWQLGWILCDIWISLDVLLCTASILSLCAISVDRYLAVTRPLTYSKRRRSKRLALLMIFVVWLVALAITCPPILGWYDQDRRTLQSYECHYNQNKGYVVFSAMGSFFIPMTVMLYVYSKICCVLTSRQNRMTKTEATEKNCDIEVDNCTSDADTSPRQMVSGAYGGRHALPAGHYPNGSSSNNTSHQTLYEFLSSTRTTPNVASRGTQSTTTRNGSNASGMSKFSGATFELRPINTVQFSASQISLSESCASNVTNNATKIRLHGKRIPIRISSLKRETKTAQTLSMVVGGFIACWLPFFVYYLLMPFLPDDSKSDDLMEFLTWLGWINSAINPFIYAFYNVDFRVAFWRLTLRKFFKNKHNLTFYKS
ncbi:probable G-protein coupled receptor No18 isoform X2 [Anopheles funestus]|uniref:probable G-protein coupled receptor No18 isoform X2 n=1 Tax=Anopheles funestus TaxID=62324 RepID=UPI0020C5BA3E|nr:probable G-protein coupled receptor No18 isoform X2 [Anopheles funestus]